MPVHIQRGKDTRKRILDAIVDYIQEHGYPPTVREIGDAVGLKSTSTVHMHLNKMLIEGTIETDEGSGNSRAIRVPGYEFKKK